jgi:glutathione S-transferase
MPPPLMTTIQIIGSPLSPYVRKVLAVLRHKGLAFELDPIVPFYGNDEFTTLSPLRRIPVYRDEHVTLCDSSVICQYLEERFVHHPLYPANIEVRARARWFEEYADSRLGEVFIWRLFYQLAIRQAVWGEGADKAVLDHALQVEIPEILNWLESQLPEDGLLCGELSIADLSVAVFFRNAAFVRFRTDPVRWPKVAFFVDKLMHTEPLAGLRAMEEALLRSPPLEHRRTLSDLGVPLTARTLGTATARRGVMKID